MSGQVFLQTLQRRFLPVAAEPGCRYWIGSCWWRRSPVMFRSRPATHWMSGTSSNGCMPYKVRGSLILQWGWETGGILYVTALIWLEKLLQNVAGFSDYDLPRRVPRHGHSFLSSLFVAVCGRGWGEWWFILFLMVIWFLIRFLRLQFISRQDYIAHTSILNI